jgi:hypothetical protein
MQCPCSILRLVLLLSALRSLWLLRLQLLAQRLTLQLQQGGIKGHTATSRNGNK